MRGFVAAGSYVPPASGMRMIKQVDVRGAVHRVRQEASAARAFFHTWNELNLARGDPQLRATMNDYEYVDFFHVSLASNFRLMFLSLGSLFDKNSKALSLRMVAETLKTMAMSRWRMNRMACSEAWAEMKACVVFMSSPPTERKKPGPCYPGDVTPAQRPRFFASRSPRPRARAVRSSTALV